VQEYKTAEEKWKNKEMKTGKILALKSTISKSTIPGGVVSIL
jgi:hypothetical protein